MIPRKVHYVWFGGQAKPALVVDTIESWKRVLPDYEITEWNEANFDITLHPWMEEMFRTGRFAFASDWARLYVLQQHGGIYLDTDVELKKPLDRFLDSGMFWGFEYDCYLGTFMIGSRPGHPLLKELLAEYDGLEGNPINNAIVTRYFLKNVPSFRLNNKDQLIDGDIRVYSKEYFSVPCHDETKNFSRHHGSNLWIDGGRKTSSLKGLIRRMLGEVLYFKIIAWRINRINEFGPIYQADKRQ
jgi:Glycosyltransferase sugar-binding region containing DXD motif